MHNASGPVPPPAPPPPSLHSGNRSWRDKMQTKDRVAERESLSKPLTITIDGEEVPRALATAFNNPRKDKKPFSYFTGGQAPDLTNKPSPKSVRKSNPPIYIPGAPKVLPIVSDEELEYEEKRQPNLYSQPNPQNSNMSQTTLLHAQYNSPMALYSRDNVQEELSRATGQAGRPSSALGGSKFNVEHQSGAYRMLHGDDRVPVQHSARLEEQKSEDYPRYRGFVDPNVQSPSFKRLQHLAGLDSGTDEEVHSASRGATAGGRQSASIGQEPIPLGYSSTTTATQNQTEAYQNGPAQPQVVQSRVYSPTPQWPAEGPPVAQYDPTNAEERDYPLDPNFAAKIAAAERPNVPPSVSPSWARKAEEKQLKWQGYTNQQQQGYQQQQQSYQQPQPQYQSSSPIPMRQEYQPPRHYQPPQPQPGWSQPSSQGYQDKWQRHYSQYNFEQGRTGQEHRDQQVITRPRSTDPDSWRRREKEPWLKPYVAPNVEGARFSPNPGGNPGGRPHSVMDTAPSWAQQPTFGGQAYGSPEGGPPGSGSYTKKTTSTSYRSHTTSRSPQPPQEFGMSYAPRKEVNVSTLVSGEAERPPPSQHVPDWSYKADEKRQLWENYGSNIDPNAQRRPPLPDRPPAWTQRADDTTKLWRNEAEAWRQRSQMEQDVSKRAASAGPGSGGDQYGSGAFWRQKPVPHQQEGTVTTYSTTGAPPAPGYSTTVAPPVAQKWQDASGASTKSQSQGTYLDRDGNQVNYVKEVYTSSDPGKEFSMLTQEEKKTLEEPLEPGVVSRHVTSKYYKKSTYTSQTSTSTSQAPPSVSYPQMHQRSIDAPPRPGSYGPGDTQF